MDITPEQIRAARALLRIEQDELARLARVSVTTIRRLESVGGSVAAATLADVRHALEEAGAEFIEDGVRCRPKPRRDPKVVLELLREISRESAALLAGGPPLTDADLYDENGLPK